MNIAQLTPEEYRLKIAGLYDPLGQLDDMGSKAMEDEVIKFVSVIPAIPNIQLRQLEHYIQKNDRINIYIVSSFKEEFGIAAIEALEAGFLLLNPKNSGLSYYLTEKETGFIIDTSTLVALRNDINEILRNHTEESLKEIAENGRMMCQQQFNIEKIASDFIDFYNHLK